MFGTRRLRSSILALNVVALLLGVTTLGYGLYAIYAAVRMAPHNESDTPDTPGTPRTSNGVVIGLSVAAAVALAIAGLFGLCAGAMGLHAVGDVGVPSSWHSSRGLHVTSFVFSIFCIALWAALLAVYALYDAGVIVLSILTFIMELSAIIFIGVNYSIVASELLAVPLAPQQQQGPQMVNVNVPQQQPGYPQAGYPQAALPQAALPQQAVYQQPTYDPAGYQYPMQQTQAAPVYAVPK